VSSILSNCNPRFSKENLEYVQNHLKTLKVIGSVGEPINEEAWHWYNDNVGSKNALLSILGGKNEQEV
jgi:acyl-coenzyme A synthetase/AMP-(fatty) acid ligase